MFSTGGSNLCGIGGSELAEYAITSEDIKKWNAIFQNKMQEPAMLIYLYWASELIKSHLEY